MLLIPFEKVDEAALLPAESELAKLPASAQQPKTSKKKRGPKGPNPLSVKRKKPQHAQPNMKPNSTPIGSKRKMEDEQNDVDASAETGLASGGGHKRKRRRKPNIEPSADDVAP